MLFFFLIGQSYLFPGVYLGPLKLGGQTLVRARQRLEALQQTWPATFCFSNPEHRFCFPTSAVSFRLDEDASLAQIRYQPWLSLLRGHYQSHYPLIYRLDWRKLDGQLASAAAALRTPFIPPTLVKKDDRVVLQPGQLGEQLDYQQLHRQLAADLAAGRWRPSWSLSRRRIGRHFSRQQLEEAQRRANQLLGKKLLLTSPRGVFRLGDEQLIHLVGFAANWSLPAINAYLAALAKDINQPPRDALFQFERGRVKVFRPSVPGWQLETAPSRLALIAALNRLLQTNLAQIQAELVVKKITPKITTANSNRLGISELVASGESYFYGSSANRIYNLSLASQKLNGLLIAPGEVFSLNHALGEISAASGFKSAYVIQNGRTVLGDGGGVCQVATTLFRAALRAGLPILERHAHAYRVHYYEEKAPLGLDATIFAPSVDLKFRNDYTHYLLLTTEVDRPHFHLVYRFYGRRDGRRVVLSAPKTWDWRPAPPPRYVDDPGLPPGRLKQIDWAAAGIKVAVEWQVWRDGQILHQQTFYSDYQPWQAIYLRGKGG